MVCATVDGNIVVGLSNAVADDSSHHEVEVLHDRQLIESTVAHEHLQVLDTVAQGNHLHFEQRVALLQVFVDVVEMKITGHRAHRFIYGGRGGIGRGEIDALLIGIVAQQEHKAQDHIDYEHEPSAVLDKEIEQIVHRGYAM